MCVRGHEFLVRPKPPGCSATWIARLHGVQKVAGSNPVTPTKVVFEPFGQLVERLSLCGD